MLRYFIAVPVAFLVAQGFWTLIAYIITWCGFPKAGAVVFWVSLAFTSLGPHRLRVGPAPAQPHRGLTAVCSACTLVAHSDSTERGKHVFMEPDRTDVRRVVRNLSPVGQDLDLLTVRR